MSADLILKASTSNNPFEIAKRSLIEKLVQLSCPRPINVNPFPDDFETVSSHIAEAAQIFDAWLSAVGFEGRQNAPCRVNTDLFEDVFSEAVVGWATGEVDRCRIITQAELEGEFAS